MARPNRFVREREGAGVGGDAGHGQAGGPGVEGVQQDRVALERVHGMSGSGEDEGHPPGPGPDVEDRARGGGGELEPEREVGRVGAALDVVPDDGVGPRQRLAPAHATAHELAAAPRATSRARSSSMAV